MKHSVIRNLIIAAIMAAMAGLTCARLHGFSFSMWHVVIDNSPQAEVLAGRARAIRADDWLVNIPHCMAQQADRPPFRQHNQLIGDGHYNMIVTGAAPVIDPATLFRPHIWGYFISGDTGMAFEWWFKFFGLWLAIWALLRRLTGNDEILAACGATAMVYAPFCQGWSLNCAPSIMFAAGAMLAIHYLAHARRKRDILLAAAALTWTGTALLMTFHYTPYLITLSYLIIFCLPALCARQANGAGDGRRRMRLAALGLCLAAICAMIGHVWTGNLETIQAIRASAYPGQRISPGGTQTIWHIMRGNAISLFPPDEWHALNSSEASSFLLFFPLVIAITLYECLRTRRRPPLMMMCLTAYMAGLLVWNLAGLPPAVARWTLLGRVPALRTIIGFGLADLMLLAAYVKFAAQSPPGDKWRRLYFAAPLIAGWTLLHLALVWKAVHYFPGYTAVRAGAGILPAIACAALLFVKPRMVLPALMLASIMATAGINPLNVGGSRFVMQNPLSMKIRALAHDQDASASHPRWMAYGDMRLPVLCRMLGAHALNGLHAYSQTGLWHVLDEHRRHAAVHNRYAHVIFSLPETAAADRIKLVQPDIVLAELHPLDPRFEALQIDYILCRVDHAAQLDQIDKLQRIFQHADILIYRVARRQ